MGFFSSLGFGSDSDSDSSSSESELEEELEEAEEEIECAAPSSWRCSVLLAAPRRGCCAAVPP